MSLGWLKDIEYVEDSPKQEYDFDIEYVNKVLAENEALYLDLQFYVECNAKLVKENNELHKKLDKKPRHTVYKRELARCVRKLTRLYNFIRWVLRENDYEPEFIEYCIDELKHNV